MMRSSRSPPTIWCSSFARRSVALLLQREVFNAIKVIKIPTTCWAHAVSHGITDSVRILSNSSPFTQVAGLRAELKTTQMKLETTTADLKTQLAKHDTQLLQAASTSTDCDAVKNCMAPSPIPAPQTQKKINGANAWSNLRGAMKRMKDRMKDKLGL